jgi:hypothetical protein
VRGAGGWAQDRLALRYRWRCAVLLALPPLLALRWWVATLDLGALMAVGGAFSRPCCTRGTC